LRGVVQFSKQYGPWEFFQEPEFYLSSRRKRKVTVRDLGADGIIAHTYDKESIEEILSSGTPAVICGIEKTLNNVVNVVADNAEIGKTGAEYLLRLGFRQFAYCGLKGFLWSDQRGESFSEAITRAGFESHVWQQYNAKTKYSHQKVQALMTEWLKSLPKPITIMACNDDHARDVIEACKIVGFAIPQEIAILGVDNDELVCDLCHCPLSSIAIGVENAGYDAAMALDGMMKGKKMHKQTIVIRPLYVVRRQSTDILATDDAEVVDAVRFIYQHSNEIISVQEVADAVGSSRRTLERRFDRVLGHSVYEEIECCHVAQIARMLVETDMPVSQIALSLGHRNAANISRYFRRRKGVTPLLYRKRYRISSRTKSL